MQKMRPMSTTEWTFLAIGERMRTTTVAYTIMVIFDIPLGMEDNCGLHGHGALFLFVMGKR